MKKITIRAPEYLQKKEKRPATAGRQKNDKELNFEDFVERNRRIHEQYAKNIDNMVCPFCHEKTDKLVECAECHAEGCSSCFTYDAGKNEYFCPKCW